MKGHISTSPSVCASSCPLKNNKLGVVKFPKWIPHQKMTDLQKISLNYLPLWSNAPSRVIMHFLIKISIIALSFKLGQLIEDNE